MDATERVHIAIRGAVQGVGFRPFIYRLATGMDLPGWVANSPEGVFIELEGARPTLDAFLARIEKQKPPRSFIQSMEHVFLDPVGYHNFTIRPSIESGRRNALVLPDIATCPECLAELSDPSDRRYRYPFTNCTNCGPRFSIIRDLPYDRSRTTMAAFVMCATCRKEYENPLDRRYHAQPNACPECGPHLELWSRRGEILGRDDEALRRAADAVRAGLIVAVKGIGGFHLMVDARNGGAVKRLRQRKHRPEKPLALLFPSIDLAAAVCEISEPERRMLLAPEAPIVLLARSTDRSRIPWEISPSVAPGNPTLGIMLPSNPLHHLLMKELGFPIVATSGNISDEPLCTDEREALERLAGIADLFLVHNRPIERHVDDSIVRTMMGRTMVVRRARGYAPLPLHLACNSREGSDRTDDVDADHASLLGVGAHLKNAVAFVKDRDVFVSQHIGDLETVEAFDAFQRVIDSMAKLYDARPGCIVADLHPGYLSSQYARQTGSPVQSIQHHYAHVASCMADNGLQGRVLGVAWDGTGYGTDGTIWGGEFLLTQSDGFRRVATLRQFRLLGGERAIAEPRRTALGLLYTILGDDLFKMHDLAPLKACAVEELSVFRKMLSAGVASPLTSSAGRLFDATASIVGLRQRSSFEGQAAMDLEFIVDARRRVEDHYPYSIEGAESGARLPEPSSMLIINWEQMFRAILADVAIGTATSSIAAKFHNTLTEIIISIADRMGERRVVLTGGCFQNKYLTERTIRRLTEAGFQPYWHQRVPPNDGGIALGQIYASMHSARANLSQKHSVDCSTIGTVRE